MYGKAFVGSALVLALSAIQSCPAPPLAIGIGMGIGVPLAGNLIVGQSHSSHDLLERNPCWPWMIIQYIGINDNVKRAEGFAVHVRADYPEGLPESAYYAYDICKSENADGRTTTVNRQSENGK
jgi:hypothetical protein